jgi:hypothetical protein
MPRMSTAAVDANAVQLLTKRITKDLVAFQRFSDWQIADFNEPQLWRQDSPLAGASFV